MLLDKELQLSADQAVTSTGDTASTNYINAGAKGNAYHALFLEILVKEAVTSAGAATVNFRLETDDNSSFSSPTVLYESGAIGKATLVAKYIPVQIKLPFDLQQYIRVVYEVGTAALTAGKFDAFLVRDVHNRSGYAV